MSNTTVIGLDIGRSAVKVVAAHNGKFHRLIFPSIVSPAIQIGIRDVAENAALETVTIDGVDYFTGDTAKVQGRIGKSLGLSDDWTETTPYLALVASAMKRLAQQEVPGLDDPYLVIGTPSRLFRLHKDSLARRTLQAVNAQTIRVLPQPMGVYSSFVTDAQGSPIKGRHRDANRAPLSWAVIEVGHFTTDFLLIRQGQYVESASVSTDGLHFAIDAVVRRLSDRGLQVTHVEAEEILRTKVVKNFGEVIDVSAEVDAAIGAIATTILTAASTLLSEEARRLDGVLVAGGGGVVVYESLKAKWRNTLLVEHARMAVAEGYCRFGISAVAKRAMAEKHDAHV